MNDALIVTLLSAVPKGALTRTMGRGARLRLPAWAHKALLRWYVGHYKVNLDECVGGIDDYASLGDFFVRALKPGARPVHADPDVLVSPVDARVHTFGTIEGGKFLQADGQPCSVGMLLGVGDPRVPKATAADVARYEGGGWAILYLSPKDYHRVHTPASGTVSHYRYLPGQFWPVFPAATQKVQDLFARNERLVFTLDTPFGQITEVMVGAFGVSRMTTAVGPLITNTGGGAEDVRLNPPMPVERAGELGRFNMGSTVILLTEPGQLQWTLVRGADVRLGQPIARRA